MKETSSAPSRRGKEISVLTPHGRETYQIWLDRGAFGWVARIVTLPNRIWAHPGGREALKFHAPTPEAAAKAAERFIEEECIATGRRIAPPAEGVAMRPVQDDGASRSRPSPRYARRLLVRFGTKVLEHPGVTANVSESGMFIITDKPAPEGAPVLVDVRFPEGPVLLEGQVVWVRRQREVNRSLGFGIRLKRPYQEYAKRLREW